MRTSIISCILISLIPVPATLAATIPAERAIPPPDVNIEQLDRRNMPPVAHPPMPDWAASEAGGSFTFKWPGKDPSSGWQTKTWTQSIENGKKGKWELYQDWSEGLFGDTSVKIPALKSKKDREGKLGMSIQYWHESKSYKYECNAVNNQTLDHGNIDLIMKFLPIGLSKISSDDKVNAEKYIEDEECHEVW